MSGIKTSVKKITSRIKNYATHVSRPGNHGLPGMMNTGHGAAPKKGMGKSSPMKFDAFQSEDKQRETAMKESQENIENTAPTKSVAGMVARKAGQKAASKGAQKGTDAVAEKHGIDNKSGGLYYKSDKKSIEAQIKAANKRFGGGVKVKQYSEEEVKDAKQLKRKRRGDTRTISKKDIEKSIKYHKKSGGKPAETARQERARLSRK